MNKNRPLLYITLALLVLVIAPRLFTSLYVGETGTISQFGIIPFVFFVYGLYREWKWVARLLIVFMAILLVFSVFVLSHMHSFRIGFIINIAAVLIVAYNIHQLKFMKAA